MTWKWSEPWQFDKREMIDELEKKGIDAFLTLSSETEGILGDVAISVGQHTYIVKILDVQPLRRRP